MSSTSVRVTTLPNGLRVATDTMPHTHSVTTGLWVDAGSRHEAPGQNGIAHALEHMMFKGTARRSARRIAEESEDLGAQLNAHTGREHTAYFARTLPEHLEEVADILVDMVRHSAFDPGEWERERQVILQEIAEVADTPDDLIFDRLYETAYPAQAIGRPILGTAHSLSAIAAGDLAGFVAGHYRPQSCVFAAAGQVEHERVVALAERLLGDLPGDTPGRSTGTAPMGHGAEPEPARFAGTIAIGEDDLEMAHVACLWPAVGHHDPDLHAVGLLSSALGGGMSSRLFQRIREQAGLAYSVYTFQGAFTDGGALGFYAGTAPDQVAAMVDLARHELAAMIADPTPAELERAHRQARASLLMSLDSTFGRADALASQLLVFQRAIPVAETLARLQAVTLDDLARVASRVLSPRPAACLLGPPLPGGDPRAILEGLAL